MCGGARESRLTHKKSREPASGREEETRNREEVAKKSRGRSDYERERERRTDRLAKVAKIGARYVASVR